MMKIIQRETESVAILELQGRVLGGPECDDIVARVNDIMKRGIVNVVFDLEKVALMNSNGLAMLATIQKSLQRAGGNVRLSRCRDRIMRIIEGAGLVEFFLVFDSIDDTVHSFEERKNGGSHG
jgi:anti-anti-sigma factor